MTHNEIIIRSFVTAFSTADETALSALLAKDAQFYVTNADGGANLLQGADAIIANLRALYVLDVKKEITITQTLSIDAHQILFMVAIKAERQGRFVNNFAAFLTEIKDEKITVVRMVEALQAESDQFWKS